MAGACQDDLGFLFLYEMLTGSLPLRILKEDSPHNWAAIMIRLLPGWVGEWVGGTVRVVCESR